MNNLKCNNNHTKENNNKVIHKGGKGGKVGEIKEEFILLFLNVPYNTPVQNH